jgi:hypothetical protein
MKERFSLDCHAGCLSSGCSRGVERKLDVVEKSAPPSSSKTGEMFCVGARWFCANSQISLHVPSELRSCCKAAKLISSNY